MNWSEFPNPKVFKRQVVALTFANLKTRYRKTFLGFVWVLLSPLIMYGVQSQIFVRVLKIDVANYYVFLLSGLLPWIFIAQSIEMSTPLLQNSGNILKSFPAHPLVYLSAQLADNLINFVAAFALILIPLAYFQALPASGMLLAFFSFLPLSIGLAAWCWFLSTLQIFYRDTRYLVTFGLGVLFFLSPIFYPVEFVPAEFVWLAQLNPIQIMIAPFRHSLYQLNTEAFIDSLLKASALAALSFGLSYAFWRKKWHTFYVRI